MQANFHTFASAVFKISNKEHVQSCAGVPEGAALEAFVEKLDACLLELECGLLVNITEVYSKVMHANLCPRPDDATGGQNH